jgi:hypothetical protein
MKPISRLAALAALAVAVAGCDATFTQQPGGGFGPPQVMVATPGGDYPLYAPPGSTPSMEPSLSAPPGFYAQNPASLPLPASGWQNGTYDGTASLLENDSGDCAFQFAMTNLHVNNGYVRFAAFHGRVASDGGVRMADGSLNWITGHLSGSHFGGVYTNRWCTYRLSLDRVGP